MAARRNMIILPIYHGPSKPSGPPGPPEPPDKIGDFLFTMGFATGIAAYVEAVVRKKSTITGTSVYGLGESIGVGMLGAVVGLTCPISFPCLLLYKAFEK